MPRRLVGIFSARREISHRRHPAPLTPGTLFHFFFHFFFSFFFSRTIQLENEARRREVVAQVSLFNREHQRREPSFHSLRLVEGRGPSYSRRFSSNPFSFPPFWPRFPAPRDNDIAGRERNASARFTTPAGAAFTGAKLIS